ncbi:creatininase family protein [Paenibacillus koleovorans]|uniref:creatininase family protein n=1 Tax=Paenibacillus koleovorans TaxID=121608 RepID=UPI000FDB0CF8|nr:creatininase family protein [Paenibacillus koleovorans]
MLTMNNTRLEFEQAGCKTAVLPIGALEQHGSHLPVGTDTIFAGELSRRLADKLDAYLLPVIPISSSIEHRESQGTVYLLSTTLALIVRDIAESLRHSGYNKLIVVNYHGGNWSLKPAIRQLNKDYAAVQAEMEVILLFTPGIPDPRLAEIVEHTRHDVHAGEFETSLMLALHPELVKEIRPQSEPTEVPQDYMDYFDTSELTEDGYWGFPEAATAEKGAKLMELQVDMGLQYLAKLEAYKRKVAAKKQALE